MTDLLQIAIEKAKKLPASEQDCLAALMLDAITKVPEEQTRRFWIAGKKPTPEEARAAVDGLKALRKNLTLDGLSIREMIEEGRR